MKPEFGPVDSSAVLKTGETVEYVGGGNYTRVTRARGCASARLWRGRVHTIWRWTTIRRQRNDWPGLIYGRVTALPVAGH